MISAPDGPSALAAWQRHRDATALLLTDLIMPGGLGGKELELHDGENFLQKPSSSDQILRCVGASLDA